MSPQTTQEKPQNVVIVAGEASGDSHAARLVNELKELDDSIRFRGMGGDNLRAAGVDVFIDMAKISVVGFVEVLKKYTLIKAELNKLKQNIAEQPPDLLILVDFQEFNQRLAEIDHEDPSGWEGLARIYAWIGDNDTAFAMIAYPLLKESGQLLESRLANE